MKTYIFDNKTGKIIRRLRSAFIFAPFRERSFQDNPFIEIVINHQPKKNQSIAVQVRVEEFMRYQRPSWNKFNQNEKHKKGKSGEGVGCTLRV